jgi:hypothetical protein
LPMTEFDDDAPVAPPPADVVGQLESLDSVLGDDRDGPRGPGGRRDRRRPRRE